MREQAFHFLRDGAKKFDVILGLVPRTHTVILRHMPYFVYMMASRKGGTIYTGVTNDLSRRAFEHREGSASKFTRTYKVRRLVWYEEYDSVGDAIQREKNIKRYYRQWKINLIESINPEWHDLYRHLN